MPGDTLLLYPEESASSLDAEAPAASSASSPGGATSAPPSLPPSTRGPRIARSDRAAERLGRRQRCLGCGQRFGETSRYCPYDGHLLIRDEEAAPEFGSQGAVLSGRYLLLRLLGEGSAAEVYQATDQELGRAVAVKILRADLAARSELGERFRDEARQMARVAHPAVASVLDFGEYERRPYFVMPLLPGVTLRRLLEQGPLDAGRALGIALGMARALAAAHAASVLHRDLRPENVLVDVQQSDCVHVMDFGLSRAVTERAVGARGVGWGTPEYMSPERAAGAEADKAADQYAFGVVLYEMLVGRPPFQGSSFAAVLAKQMYQRPAAPSQRNPGQVQPWEPQLESLVLRCLSKRASGRYPSLDAVVVALEELSGEGSGVRSRGGPAALASFEEPPGEQFRGAALRWLRGAGRWFSGTLRRSEPPP